MDLARLVSKTKIDLLLAPVFLPGVNDEEIREIIKFAKEVGCKIGIQKYEEYRYSRKMHEVKRENFFRFYKRLKEWEKEFGIKLVYSAKDLEVGRAEKLREVLRRGERLNVKVLESGWMKDQMIAAERGRCITITKCDAKKGDRVNVRVTETKNNIYLAEQVK